jgi:large subunit ribosomal protein L30
MQHNNCVKITLVRSLIGRLPGHIRTAHALGLKRMHSFVVLPKSPTIMGMINKVNYLLKIEEVSQA